jgi:rubrerythrin
VRGIAAYFEQAARLEAASVPAFRRLVRELSAHRAPAALVARARRAAEDERRHARAMTRLARRYGSSTARTRVPRRMGAVRDLEQIAIENMREGCVRETFGAAVAGFQAARAGDETVRAAMQTIAIEEARHAELSWDVQRWIGSRLDAAARSRVADARREAVAELERELRVEVPGQASVTLGMPTAHQSAHVVAKLKRDLWS